MQQYYLCIDMKSFYASVECVERGLDPMTARLVVADPERSKNTICLAVSPAMKALGVKNRCRLGDIPAGIDFITAPPRMQKYIDYAADIYEIYLDYISKEDIYVYSIDESFLYVSPYLRVYSRSPRGMAEFLIREIHDRKGIIAAAGVGTNLYLAKIALDITAKHSPDFIGYLDEELYSKTLWDHKPLTDFWRIGNGISDRLSRYGILTMGDIANADQDLLYRCFGIDAELLIDHSWGKEPVTLREIKAYKPSSNSISSGQVLMRDYSKDEGRLIISEMATEICLRLVDKDSVTDSIGIYVGYSMRFDIQSARGTAKLPVSTNSESIVQKSVLRTYDIIVSSDYPIRRIHIFANNIKKDSGEIQLNMFDELSPSELDKDSRVQRTMLDIKHKFGKNAMFKAQDLEDAATTRERNMQIGGHKSE